MPFWPVSDAEHVEMAPWRLVRPRGCADVHVVGYCVSEHEGRVSSAIVSLDLATRVAVTSSGRQYRLRGAAGFDADADHVLAAWCRLNDVQECDDVTDDVLSAALPLPSTGG